MTTLILALKIIMFGVFTLFCLLEATWQDEYERSPHWSVKLFALAFWLCGLGLLHSQVFVYTI